MSLTDNSPATDSSPPTRAESPPSSASAPRPTGRTWQPLIRRLHFYAGILVAPFLLVAAISGGLYAIAPTVEQVVYRDQLHTDSVGNPAPVADQVRAAMAVRPDLALSAVRPAAEPGDTTRVLFTDPSLGESERLAVFIDPVTLASRGELVSYGSSAALPMRTWLSNLHRNLHLGEPGRLYSELAASWLWVIALGGLILWVSQYRKRRDAPTARLFAPERGRSGRSRLLNQHGVIGIWLVAGLVFLSATGLTWSKYAGENVSELRSALSWTTPSVNTALTGDAIPAGGDHADHSGHQGHDPAATPAPQTALDGLDAALSTAAGAGVGGDVEATVPTKAGTAITVTQTRQPWQFSPDAVSIDPTNGRVVDESRFADWPLAAQLTNWGIALHMGILFGLANQIALLLLSIALVILIVRGYQMWWHRRPQTAGPRAVGAPPVRGTLRRLGAARCTALAVIALAVGWFVPLLGISLLAFLVLDVIIGVTRRRASATS
ncbi:PepSY domain-containing protein [Gordonia sp. ABSL1-1]|uniref:PepSY-associated TM helix domain-containing protein n=1 Tax=Gordonia sp. ABSL1-1 TaxID=3053923 RepID=UPI002572DDC1|nr:PepSY domain-containing protein [Gordonia sp. ABSL1-1]MDL9938356.1 PepSY domain-containing protein [Gordonia sp. ABSL1-1]